MIKSSDILVLGGGVSSIFPILLGKKRITLINDGKLFSRILISGNGRCNFFNEHILDKDNDVLNLILNNSEINYPSEVLNYIKNELHIDYYKKKDYYYPFFNKSECFYYPLITKINESGFSSIDARAIRIDSKNKIVTYLKENKEEKIKYNKLIVATGGFSYLYKQDYSLLNSLDIKINEFKPSLCPIITKEKIPSYLFGTRLKGKATILVNGIKKESEEGEILFKKDGLSGISIFNLTNYINKYLRENKNNKIEIIIDYLNHDGYSSLNFISYPEALRKYIKDKNLKENEMLKFTFSSLYSFKESQASYGGISLDEIDLTDFSLKKYKDIYVAGEIIDLNFRCGGYNIGYNMIEGYKVIKKILQDGK